MSDAEHEERVRQRAYELWEQDGRPHGRHVEYWQRARAEIEGEDGATDAEPLDDEPLDDGHA